MFDPQTAKIKLTWKTTVDTTINTHGNSNVIVSLPGVCKTIQQYVYIAMPCPFYRLYFYTFYVPGLIAFEFSNMILY